MKTACLFDRLDRMPMAKLLAPFAAGILLAACYELPLWFLAGAFVCTGVVALLFRSGVALVVMLLTSGFSAAQLREPEVTVPRKIHTVYEVIVEGFPVERSRYSVADAAVTAWRNPTDGHWHASDARIRLYADSLTLLQAGERIRCQGRIRPFQGGAESYRRLMERRGYAGTLWIGERSILDRKRQSSENLHLAAVQVRAGQAHRGQAAVLVGLAVVGAGVRQQSLGPSAVPAAEEFIFLHPQFEQRPPGTTVPVSERMDALELVVLQRRPDDLVVPPVVPSVK